MSFPIINPSRPGTKHPLIIVDIDGVWADIGTPRPMDWGDTLACESIMASNIPHWPIISLTNALHSHYQGKVAIVAMTGRPEKFGEVTVAWLLRNHVKHDRLLMRRDGDERPDAEVKRSHLQILRQQFDIWMVFEDRASVVKMWREEGILCFQNCAGEY